MTIKGVYMVVVLYVCSAVWSDNVIAFLLAVATTVWFVWSIIQELSR